jgi:glycosyltransferase involved in cell wall biosynthesis
MKIGFSTSVIQRGKTGVAQYVFSLLRAIARESHDHRFCLFVLEQDREFFAGFDERFELVPVSEAFRGPIKNILWHQTALPRLAAKLELDLLHVPSYRRMLWSAPCPRAATIHDLAPFRVSNKYDLARMFYGRVVVKQIARTQNQIITVSRNTARDIEQFFGIPQSRVRVIHNGIDHERFFPRDRGDAMRTIGAKYGLNKPFFLYVARLEHPGKNHVRLIEAFELFRERTGSDWLLAFGGSDWHGAEAIHERIRRSPACEAIRPLGFIPSEDLPILYSAAGAFVYPSLYEGFGLPPVEAMACGCPVICSGRGSLEEVVGNAAKIIDPENPGSMAEALQQLFASPDYRADLARLGLERARHFSWEQAARDTLAAWHSTMLRSRSTGGVSPAVSPLGARGTRPSEIDA